MSDESSPNTPLAGVLNTLMLIGSPIALVLMLGFLGVYFIGGMGDGNRGKEEKAPAAAPAAGGKAGGEQGAAPAVPAKAEGVAAAGAEIDPAVMELGKATYAICGACHGPDAKGLPVGPALMAPSQIGSEILLGDPEVPILVVLKGIAKETNDFMGVMAPLGASLSDEQIAAVLTYLRNLGGNQASAVTTEQVVAARAKFADVNTPAGVKRSEIPAILQAHK